MNGELPYNGAVVGSFSSRRGRFAPRTFAERAVPSYNDTALQTIGIGGALFFGIGLLLAAIMSWSILRSIAGEEYIEFRYHSKLDRTFRTVLALGGLEFDAESGPNVYRYRVLLR